MMITKETDCLIGRVGLEAIKQILPHRGRMLLLDEVKIKEGKVIGNLLVRREICEGHPVLKGKLVFKGSDLLDMAAQLLGIYSWIQLPEFRGRLCIPREYGGAKFKNPIFPGDLIDMSFDPADVMFRINGNHVIIIGKHFVVTVRTQLCAVLSYVFLVAF